MICTCSTLAPLSLTLAPKSSLAPQVPHDIKGHAIFAFVILRPGYSLDAKLQQELKVVVRQEVCNAAYAPL